MILQLLARKFPYLKIQLAQANIQSTPEKFLKKTLTSSLIIATTITLSLMMVFYKLNINLFYVLILIPIVYSIVFFFLMYYPKAISNKITREIDHEIVYAGRFLIIELSAGTPLYDAINNISNAHPAIGKYFKKIIDKVESGKPIDLAINEVMEITPSPNFRKLLFQIVNSMRTGGDINKGLESITDQISKEQLIRIKEYGKRLNPLVLFYLLVAIIMPSLGIAVLALMSIFTGFVLSLSNLIGISVLIGLMQFSFLSLMGGLRKGL